jgi:hypothetical protein
VAKAAVWLYTDTKARRRGEQTGLDTLVVHAVNDVNWLCVEVSMRSEANALSLPPGKYGRKTKTQRN